MDGEDIRFSLPAEKYLERHSVLIYLEDAVAQLLEHKDDNPKINSAKFFSEYFNSIKEGNHVLYREYDYVSATPHNRACFVQTIWKCFRNIGRKGDLLSIKEYHSLLGLLCPDFPFQPLQKTARIILMDDAMDCLISFSDFLFAFQTQFCYDEFLTQCAEVYKTLQQNPQSSHEAVVVPTSSVNAELSLPPHNVASEANQSDGVECAQFLRALLPITDKLGFNAPPVVVLRDILSTSQRVTFYGFLMALAKSEKLNQMIGKLPSKNKLLEVSEQEANAFPVSPAAGIARPSTATGRQGITITTTSTQSAPTSTPLGSQSKTPATTTTSGQSNSAPTTRPRVNPPALSQRRKRNIPLTVLQKSSSDDSDDSSDSSTN